MIRKYVFIVTLILLFCSLTKAQNAAADTIMILPFENTSNKAEFNWVGESFADALTDLLKVPALNVVSNQERKLLQQGLRVPLTILPSTATSLKLARTANASILISGKYSIIPEQGDRAASVNITAKIIRVKEGRFLNEELPDGRRVTRDINLTDALGNLQTVQGQLAYQILYQRDKALPFSQNQFIDAANKVPARAFEAYIKGLLTDNMAARENYFKNALRIFADEKEGKVYSEAALELGHYFLNNRKFNDAVEYFSRISQESPQYAEAAFYTGLIYWRGENYEQALAVLRPLAEDLKLTSVSNSLGAIAVQASRAEKKNKGKSDALLNEGIETLKQTVESAPENINIKFNYGLALFLNKSYNSAVEQLKPILAANPKDGESYFLLAKALEITNDPTAADIDNQARRFLTVGDRYAKLQTEWQKSQTVGGIDLRIEQPARKDFVSVILTKRQNETNSVQTPQSDTEKSLAEARKLYSDGRDDESMAVLRRILSAEPMSGESYLLLGLIHLRRGDLDQSVSSLKTALFWNNQLIDAHIALGKIYVQKGDCLQAQNYARSAAEINSENVEAQGLQRQIERCSK